MRIYDPKSEAKQNARESQRGRCVVCSELMGKGYKRITRHRSKNPTGVCMGCVKARTDDRRRRICVLWADGHTMQEIAYFLDITKERLGPEMAHMRRAGWDLPYRYRRPVA